MPKSFTTSPGDPDPTAESARRQAIDVLLDQRLFVLNSDRYDAFAQALDDPPPPRPKLKSLLRRVPQIV